MYEIFPQQRQIATSLGVKIHPSHNYKYKIDILDWNGQYITSCGALKYNDYFLYKKEKGIEYAERRRDAYRKRHHKNLSVEGSRSYYSYRILWRGGGD